MGNNAFDESQVDDVTFKTDEGIQVDESGDITVVEETKLDLIYSIHDTPPWYLSILLGFQHFLISFGGGMTIPYIMLPAMCTTDPLVLAEVINTGVFVSGLVTTSQIAFGVRLPIVQGGTAAFLAPAFAILNSPKWKCPADNVTDSCGNVIEPENVTQSGEDPNDPDIWKPRMREVQGAIILASLFQVVIGITGVVGVMLRFLGPLVIAPTIALIGISLFGVASDFCSHNWYIALMTIVFIIVFSQYLRNVDFPCFQYKRKQGCKCAGYPLFKLFPVILAVCVSWIICAILTVTDAMPDNPEHWAYRARTDAKAAVFREANWFRFPYPGQWGTPTFSTAGVFGMLAAVIAGIIESIGDYYACARLSGAPPPPVHAINRGIFIEGIGCVVAGCFGTGTGSASYSGNIAAIGITKVGSTRVVFFGGLIMILLGLLGKFGAVFAALPTPIVGGIFMIMFAMITSVGISNLQHVNMNSSRNLFVFGFSLFFGLSVSQWMAANSDAINTGSDVADQIITVLLSTSMFVGGAVAFILDNTISGSDEERGLHVWRKMDSNDSPSNSEFSCYDLPFGMNFIRKWNWTKYIPLCPTFNNCSCSSLSQKENDNEAIQVTSSGMTNEKVRQRKSAEINGTKL